MKHCVLDNTKTCNDCGRCDDLCELDPTKLCDNCFKCLELEQDYATITIGKVYLNADDYSQD